MTMTPLWKAESSLTLCEFSRYVPVVSSHGLTRTYSGNVTRGPAAANDRDQQ